MLPLPAVVTVQHKELAYDVREDAGSARVCAVVTGLSESDVGVSFTTRNRGNGAVGKPQKRTNVYSDSFFSCLETWRAQCPQWERFFAVCVCVCIYFYIFCTSLINFSSPTL